MYSEDRRVWNAIFEIVAKDLHDGQQNGVYLSDVHETVFPIVLGNKGDWSYLVTWLNSICCLYMHSMFNSFIWFYPSTTMSSIALRYI